MEEYIKNEELETVIKNAKEHLEKERLEKLSEKETEMPALPIPEVKAAPPVKVTKENAMELLHEVFTPKPFTEEENTRAGEDISRINSVLSKNIDDFDPVETNFKMLEIVDKQEDPLDTTVGYRKLHGKAAINDDNLRGVLSDYMSDVLKED